MIDPIDPMEADYPLPDPDWDYYGIWHEAHTAKQKLEKLIAYLAEIEDATSESDRAVREQLEQIAIAIDSASRMMKP